MLFSLLFVQSTTSVECAINLVIAYSKDERTRNVFGLVRKLLHRREGREVFVRTPSTRAIPMTIDLNGTVEKLKQEVQTSQGVPANEQLLTVDGVQLQDGHKLSDYNIQTDSTVHLSLRLLGGKKQTCCKCTTGNCKDCACRKNKTPCSEACGCNPSKCKRQPPPSAKQLAEIRKERDRISRELDELENRKTRLSQPNQPRQLSQPSQRQQQTSTARTPLTPVKSSNEQNVQLDQPSTTPLRSLFTTNTTTATTEEQENVPPARTASENQQQLASAVTIPASQSANLADQTSQSVQTNTRENPKDFRMFKLSEVMRRVPMIGNGNCTANSIASGFYGASSQTNSQLDNIAIEHHASVRQKICEILENHNNFIDTFDPECCCFGNLEEILEICKNVNEQTYNNKENFKEAHEKLIKFRNDQLQLKENARTIRTQIKSTEDEEQRKQLEAQLAESEQKIDKLKKTMDEALPFKTRYQLYVELTSVDRVWLEPEHCRAAAIGLNAKIFVFLFKASANLELIGRNEKDEAEIVIEKVYSPEKVDENTKSICIVHDDRHFDLLIPHDANDLVDIEKAWLAFEQQLNEKPAERTERTSPSSSASSTAATGAQSSSLPITDSLSDQSSSRPKRSSTRKRISYAEVDLVEDEVVVIDEDPDFEPNHEEDRRSASAELSTTADRTVTGNSAVAATGGQIFS